MNSDKLGWMMSTADARSASAAQTSREDLETLKNAIRAQLMHVAIGCTRSTTRTIRIMIDLSVFLSMERLAPRIYGKIGRGYMIAHRAALPYQPVSNSNAFEHEAAIDANYGVICTMATQSIVDHILPASGEPVTLRLLFDSDDTHTARKRAEQICERFSHWNTAETSLKKALSAIQNVIADDSLAYVNRERLLYISAFIHKGWKADNLDVSDFGITDRSGSYPELPKIPTAITDFCLHTMVDTWSETARQFNAIDPLLEQEPDGSDLATSVDAADSFVSAETMSRLWYGKKRQPKRDQ